MKVLVGCELSGTIRDAFLRAGADAWSCDILPTDVPGPHIQGDVRNILDYDWDLGIFNPPCTDLAVSGAAWFAAKGEYRQEVALMLVRELMNAPIPHICIENPVSVISSHIRKPDQIIQPWMFGHGETKATCLWLKNLAPLVSTNYVEGREQRLHRLPPSPDRAKIRSKTFQGIADAMAAQWSDLNNQPLQYGLFERDAS